MSLTTTVTPDPLDDVILIAVTGLLTVETAPVLRSTLMKCLAQVPGAIIVETGELQVDHRSRLAVFPAALRTHGGPGTVLMLCGASGELATQMDIRALGGIASYPTYTEAHAAAVIAAAQWVPRTVTLRLGPVPAAARQARAMIADACRSWRLEQLTEAATLIVSELVSNGVEHAGTDLVVKATYRGNYLHLSVRDDSPAVPVRRNDGVALATRGRGLHLIGVYASAWGVHAMADGKTVWATLRV
ncbi:ATP-binding protein [Winogradskya humida]|uniref:Sulfate transporter n=1 Tax=Winogradskya humida TaxID=113566 RepID=A0ABQ4A900_9ACTN|nr:ATP-binding protein [Actinoplanes humidus]GIE26812.1 sulfate transporter [Actinoplanes humidus]